jgi:hypothetical protein
VTIRIVLLITLLFFHVDSSFAAQYSRTKPVKFKLHDKGATFEFCYNWSCNEMMDVDLNAKFLDKIAAKIKKCATSAENELLAIRNAVRDSENQILLEHEIFVNDIAGNKLDKLKEGALDCVDNSSNTNAMLHLMEKRNPFKYWKVDKPYGRGFFRPHWTATLRTEDKEFINKYRDKTQIGKKDYTIWTMDTWLTTFAFNPFLFEINDWLDALDPWGNDLYRGLYHQKLECWGPIEPRSREDKPPDESTVSDR